MNEIIFSFLVVVIILISRRRISHPLLPHHHHQGLLHPHHPRHLQINLLRFVRFLNDRICPKFIV